MDQKRENNPLLQDDELPDVTDTFTLEEVEAGLAACGLGKELKAPE